MDWLVTQLGNIAATVFTTVMMVFGYFADAFVKFFFQTLVKPLLDNTVFAPFQITNTAHTVGSALILAWETLGAISVAVALVLLLYAAFSRMFFAIGGAASWGEVSSGVLMWLVVLIGGWIFLNLLVQISNAGTQALAQGIQQEVDTYFSFHALQPVASGASTAVVLFTYFFFPVVMLIMGALALWACGVWLMRQLDLVIYGGLLPIAAALGINGNKAPFKQIWSELMGAIFNQLAMAFIFFIAFHFLGSAPSAAQNPGQLVAAQLVHLALTITAITLAARAPQILGNLTGHHSAGSSHMLAGMALGYIGAKGLAGAAKMTKAGQTIGAKVESKQAQARMGALNDANRPSALERVTQSGPGQRIGEKLSSLGNKFRNSATGQAISQAAAETAQAHPTFTKAARAAGQAAKGVSKPLRKAAAAALQPRKTMGQMTAAAVATSMMGAGVGSAQPEHAPHSTMAQAQSSINIMGQQGIAAAAGDLGGAGPDGYPMNEVPTDNFVALGQRVNANISQQMINPATGQAEFVPMVQQQEMVRNGWKAVTNAQGHNIYQAQFAKGSWEDTMYQKLTKSQLKNIPTQPNPNPSY